MAVKKSTKAKNKTRTAPKKTQIRKKTSKATKVGRPKKKAGRPKARSTKKSTSTRGLASKRKKTQKSGKVKKLTRKSPAAKGRPVKKKPGKSKSAKKTSKNSRAKINRKLGAIKKTSNKNPEIAKVIRASSKKKQRQATKSDSQARPVEQQPTIETNMAESKKTNKQSEKQDPSQEAGLESVAETDLNIAPYKERPGEDYMNPDQLAHFRRVLLQRKRFFLEHMGRTVHHLQDEGTSLPDISDRATQEEEFSLELRARDRERKLIKKIEEALQQIDEGHYGFCNSCGVEIGIHRLEARPTANLCIDCKTLDEIREKQMGG